MGSGSPSLGQSGQGVALTAHTHLSSVEVKEGVELHVYSSLELHGVLHGKLYLYFTFVATYTELFSVGTKFNKRTNDKNFRNG